jgi:hypothetical protein
VPVRLVATVGRHIRVENKDYQVVGVIEYAKVTRIHEPPEPYMYFPFAQWPDREATFIVETGGDPRALGGDGPKPDAEGGSAGAGWSSDHALSDAAGLLE